MIGDDVVRKNYIRVKKPRGRSIHGVSDNENGPLGHGKTTGIRIEAMFFYRAITDLVYTETLSVKSMPYSS